MSRKQAKVKKKEGIGGEGSGKHGENYFWDGSRKAGWSGGMSNARYVYQ